MTNEEFVNRIRIAVYDGAVKGTISLLEKPPGRCPLPSLVELSQWFNQLSPEGKAHVDAAIQLAAGNAVFGMLAVLDGDRSIRVPEEERGTLELRYNIKGESILLNDPSGEPLHDLFGEQVPPD